METAELKNMLLSQQLNPKWHIYKLSEGDNVIYHISSIKIR